MSEPVSNAEIEDVLSSIRRLVSGEPGGVRRVEKAQEPDDRFVLTPALRVPEDDGSNDDDDLDDAPQDRHVSSSRGLRYDESLEHRIAELEQVIAQSAGDWEPDGSETDGDASEPLDMSAARIFDDADDQDDDDHDGDHDTPEVPQPEAELILPEQVLAPETDSDDDPQPEHHGDTAHEADVDDPQDTQHEMQNDDADQPDSDDLAAQLDSVIARAKDDKPEAAAEPEPEPEVENLAAADPDDDDDDRILDLSSDETVIDEESLRIMVADMVRDELQGVLGERITRNVRRLVRREIQRALATRDLDID